MALNMFVYLPHMPVWLLHTLVYSNCVTDCVRVQESHMSCLSPCAHPCDSLTWITRLCHRPCARPCNSQTWNTGSCHRPCVAHDRVAARVSGCLPLNLPSKTCLPKCTFFDFKQFIYQQLNLLKTYLNKSKT